MKAETTKEIHPSAIILRARTCRMQRYLIVSGIPASGKSTVGRALAAAMKLVMLDKDDFLEALFESEGTGDAAWRRQLSRAADNLLQEKALASDGAVITSWWRHPASGVDTGTPVEWLSALTGVAIEVHCVCSPEVAAARFLSRKRHAGHLDHLKTNADVLASFQQQATLGPLGIARAITVNTEEPVELSALIARITAALEL
jgi:predicted kinase